MEQLMIKILNPVGVLYRRAAYNLKIYFSFIFIAFSLSLFCGMFNGIVYASNNVDEYTLYGEGTADNPYIITNIQDLIYFADMVNSGENYLGKYFKQTNNIDMAGVSWTPIGIYDSGNYFYGTYDGDGHYIENLSIQGDGNNGFFGVLGGTVMNFGIESGFITGACIGGIASHSASADAAIINCYCKATLIGARAGGIADNFNGSIINCWSNCVLSAETTGGIVSYTALYIANCYSTCDPFPNYKNDALNCEIIDESKLGTSYFEKKLNSGLLTASIIGNVNYSDLNTWELSGGSIIFSSQKSKITLSVIVNNCGIISLMMFPFVFIVILFGGITFYVRKLQNSVNC